MPTSMFGAICSLAQSKTGRGITAAGMALVLALGVASCENKTDTTDTTPITETTTTIPEAATFEYLINPDITVAALKDTPAEQIKGQSLQPEDMRRKVHTCRLYQALMHKGILTLQ
jgi:hypothetical protein